MGYQMFLYISSRLSSGVKLVFLSTAGLPGSTSLATPSCWLSLVLLCTSKLETSLSLLAACSVALEYERLRTANACAIRCLDISISQLSSSGATEKLSSTTQLGLLLCSHFRVVDTIRLCGSCSARSIGRVSRLRISLDGLCTRDTQFSWQHRRSRLVII